MMGWAVLPLWKLLLCLYPSPSPLSFLASLPPRGIFLLTGGAVKFDWLSSGFDAVTSHPLREFKAIKLLQMSRHRRREMYRVVRPGAFVRPHAQRYTLSATGWWCAATNHAPSTKYDAFNKEVFTKYCNLTILCTRLNCFNLSETCTIFPKFSLLASYRYRLCSCKKSLRKVAHIKFSFNPNIPLNILRVNKNVDQTYGYFLLHPALSLLSPSFFLSLARLMFFSLYTVTYDNSMAGSPLLLLLSLIMIYIERGDGNRGQCRAAQPSVCCSDGLCSIADC